MASFKQYTASGGASEAFSIPTFTSDEIKVRVDGVLKTAGTGTTAGSSHDYEIQSYTVNGGTIAWVSGKVPSSGTVYIYRDTKLLNSASSDVEGKATYSSGQVIYHGDLNNNQKQVLRALEEQDDQLIQSWNLASGVVETDSIKDGTIVDADINASANISGSKLQASSGSNAGSMSAANFTKLAGIEASATADQSNAEIRAAVEAASDSNVFTDAYLTKLPGIEASATADQSNDEIKAAVGAASDSNIFTDALKTKLDGIATSANNYSISSDLLDEDDFATDSATKVPSQQSVKAYISNTSQPKDNELTTLAGMQAGTATQLAGGTALTSSLTELNLLDGKSVVTTVSGSSTDVQLPTAKAVNDQIANLLNEVGGFVPIADDQSFPNANPDPGDDAGTIVSIADAGGLVVNSSGVTTTGRTLGGATVTINGIDTALRGTTIAAGKGMLVQTTTTLNTYDYHRLIVDEAGVASAQTLVSDFNDRYQVAGSAPSTHPDGSALADGDLWFDTASNTMKVYDLGNTSYAAVTSVGDYKLLTVVNDGQTSGNPTYNSSNVSFDLRDGSNAASITSVGQLLISVNGVLQKPNSGSWSASNEGFHLEGTNGIKFCTAPASGDSIFVTLIGSATSVNVPATNSIVEAAIQDNQVSEGKLKISNAGTNGYFLQKQSGDTGGLTWAAAGGASSIADDSIVEAKLDIHNTPSGTDKFLKYTSNGMEWVVPSYTTNTDTQLSTEQVQDIVGAMFTGNTETNITATYEDSDGTIDLVSTNTQVGGATGVDFNDDVKARFGTGNDLELYHDATDSYIVNATNDLWIKSTGDDLRLDAADDILLRVQTNENAIICRGDGAVELYNDNEIKFVTHADGAKVQDLSGNTVELELTTAQGDGGSLYANTAASPSGTLGLTTSAGDWALKSHNNGSVELHYDGTKKIETTADGIAVTGQSDFTGHLKEAVVVTAGKLSDNTNLNIASGNVFLFTTAESTASTPNLRYDGSTSLDSKMSVGDCLSVTIITTANASGFSAQLTIDGNAVTENWTGGSAPTDGGSSGVDIHAYTIIKTGTSGTTANDYTVVANHTKTS